MNESDITASVRLDLWLWAARFYKTRALAKHAIETGKVEVDGQRAKPSRTLRVGNALRVGRGDETFEVAVLGLAEKRGPASVARTLYEESEASRLERERLRAIRAAVGPVHHLSGGRPGQWYRQFRCAGCRPRAC